MTRERLEEVLRLHKLWLNSDKAGVRANLRGADLSDANLRNADLSVATLRGADLTDADLKLANLIDADLSGANLIDADLSGARLSCADLTGANLRLSDLSSANLRGANLRGADLRLADLRGADLTDADFRNCIGNGKEIKSLQIGAYSISYTKDIINIGCKSHTLKEWKNFTDDEIDAMDKDALEWWKLNKHIIIELVERESK